MHSFFKRFFQDQPGAGAARSGGGNRENAVRIATCTILMEVARSDDDFTAGEKAVIVDALKKEYDLTAAEADELMALAERKAEESVDTWNFTNTLNQNLSEPERLRILETIWKIIYSDDKLSQHEDALVHKLSYLLGLTHDQLIDVKMRIQRP